MLTTEEKANIQKTIKNAIPLFEILNLRRLDQIKEAPIKEEVNNNPRKRPLDLVSINVMTTKIIIITQK
jgi:hypothetical protein